MKIIETTLKKLVASEGKVIVLKEKQYDENGNEIPQMGDKIIYLAINSNVEDYEEIDEPTVEIMEE